TRWSPQTQALEESRSQRRARRRQKPTEHSTAAAKPKIQELGLKAAPYVQLPRHHSARAAGGLFSSRGRGSSVLTSLFPGRGVSQSKTRFQPPPDTPQVICIQNTSAPTRVNEPRKQDRGPYLRFVRGF